MCTNKQYLDDLAKKFRELTERKQNLDYQFMKLSLIDERCDKVYEKINNKYINSFNLDIVSILINDINVCINNIDTIIRNEKNKEDLNKIKEDFNEYFKNYKIFTEKDHFDINIHFLKVLSNLFGILSNEAESQVNELNNLNEELLKYK